MFEGTRPITNLPTLPLEFHTNKDELKAKLIERGGKVENFAGSHYRAYNGVGWRTGQMGNKEQYSVKGRIVIDTHGWNRFNPNDTVFVSPLHIKDVGGSGSAGGLNFGEYGGDDEYEGGYDDEGGGMPLDGFFEEDEDSEGNRVTLSEEQKMTCTPLIRGYALKEKVWLNFFVNAVKEISFSENAFESLVLRDKQKELILGFTEMQQNHRSQFDDVIEGKGKGIILLLE